MGIEVKFRGKKKLIDVKKLSKPAFFLGLMFHDRKTKNLLFDFPYNGRHAIHSYFVFFDFLALWLDENNYVIETNIVRPFTTIIRPKKKCKKLIEIPFNESNDDIIKFFVGKRKV